MAPEHDPAWDDLCEDVVCIVLDFLKTFGTKDDIARARTVCKIWRRVINSSIRKLRFHTWDAANACSKDLGVLRALPNLQALDLHPFKTGDLELRPLMTLTALRAVNLHWDAALSLEDLKQLNQVSQCKSVAVSFDASKYVGMDDSSLSILASIDNLVWLKLPQESMVTETGFNALANLTQLTHLDLQRNQRLSDAAITKLTQLVRLKTLILSHCRNFTDVAFNTLTELHSLTQLDVAECKQLTQAGLALVARLYSLVALNLKLCTCITPDLLRALRPLTNLQDLDLSASAAATNQVLQAVGHFSALTALNVSRCANISAPGFAHLAHLTNLQRLDLGDCEQLEDAALAAIKPLHRLTDLSLKECLGVTDTGLIDLLPHMKNLRVLNLSHFNWPSPRVTDATVAVLTGLVNLESLQIDGTAISNQGFQALTALQGLTSLSVGKLRGVTNQGFTALTALSNLKYLHILCVHNISSDVFQLLKQQISELVLVD